VTKRQAERYRWLLAALQGLGFAEQEVKSLLRCQRVLSTWSEHECNGVLQRDSTTGKPYWISPSNGDRYSPTADRESGSLRRAATICARHGVEYYHQSDPRGCALYVIRPGDVPAGEDVGAYYSRGIGVCID